MNGPVLVVAAHPDDEVLGCGGTTARLSREGREVHILILGEGETSRYAERSAAPAGATDALKDHARKAAAILGAAEVCLHDFPDNRFDSLPLLEVVKTVEAAMDRIRPETVFTHHGGDLNIDHAVTFRAVLTAARPTPGSSVKSLLCFEVPSATDWAFGSFERPGPQNLYYDITGFLDIKLAALAAYDSEMKPFPHARSIEAVTALGNSRGARVGVVAAEAFWLVRSVL